MSADQTSPRLGMESVQGQASQIVSRLLYVKGPGLNISYIVLGLYCRVCGLMTRDGGVDVKIFTLDEEAC